jgi:hypothetical protein
VTHYRAANSIACPAGATGGDQPLQATGLGLRDATSALQLVESVLLRA